MIIDGTHLYMTRGDSENLTVSCFLDENIEPFEKGDIVEFTVRANYFSEKLIYKKVTEFTLEGKAQIIIEPEDTKDMEFRDYKYDIQITFADGRVKTVVKDSVLTIGGEVTYE